LAILSPIDFIPLLRALARELGGWQMSYSSATHHDSVYLSTAQQPPGPPTSGYGRKLRSALPTLAIVGLLSGLAILGHATDWTLPKFSALIGSQPETTVDWCKEHNVPESQCIECNVALVPPDKDYGWCKQHGVAQCPLDHPDVAELKAVPVVLPADLERADRALALRPRPENNSRCKLHERRIQFASAQAVEKVGIEIAVVKRRAMTEAVTANGEIIYDQTHLAHLASRVAGTVWRVEKQVGESVRKGDVLAIIEAAEVGKAKGELLQAIAQFRLKDMTVGRLRPLVSNASIPERQYREAEAARQESQIRLITAEQTLVNLGLAVRADEFAELSPEQIAERIQFLGLPSEIVASIGGEPATSNLLPLRSPLDGTVVDRKLVSGEVVTTSTLLFSVADVGRMWLMLAVRQADAKLVSLGQTVLFAPSDDPGAADIQGSVAWISTSVDDRTRTVSVRVDLPNPNGRLRANTFGTGQIILRQEDSAIVVPSEAVHSDGDCNVVFVRDKNFLQQGSAKFFHVREVRPGVKSGDYTEIIVGLLPGEVVASKNSVILESQLLKSSLGAGCGCADGH
jgi:cobalt-zinc-cadmium efflux system membrane fusion protein